MNINFTLIAQALAFAGAHSEIDQEVNRAKEALRAEVSQLALSAAEKILQKEIKKEDHSAMLTKLAKEL
jgi:F-type H+-transporting ATPase subunit b